MTVRARSLLLLASAYASLSPALCAAVQDAASAGARTDKATHVFKKVDELELSLDVYGDPDWGPRPAVVWIHGGALIFGKRGWVRDDFKALCRAERLVLVSIDYRLAPETKLPAITSDVRDALRWVRSSGPRVAGIDASRVAVAGNSAGGYLALWCGSALEPPVAAVVSYWGYGDPAGGWLQEPSHRGEGMRLLAEEDLAEPTGEPIRELVYVFFRQNAIWTREVSGIEPGAPELDPFRPIANVTSSFPPSFLVHGAEDEDVPTAASAAMAKELDENEVEHRLVVLPGLGHELVGIDPARMASIQRQVIDFLLAHLADDGSEEKSGER